MDAKSFRYLAVTTLAFLALHASRSVAVADADVTDAGRALFLREWSPGDARSVAGDGLGPLFNARSCAACHRQAGAGGAGPSEFDVVLLTRKPTAPNPAEFAQSIAKLSGTGGQPAADAPQDKLGRLHPHLAASGAPGTIVLHRHGADLDYARRRLELLGKNPARQASATDLERLAESLERRTRREPPVVEYSVGGASVQRSRRQTPALFGAGLIDRIPDAVLREEAARQRRGGRTSGRVAIGQPEAPDPYGDPRAAANRPRAVAGKFGWRGQTGSLRQFVLNACANELGLEAPGRPQAIDPLHPAQRANGLDLDRAACESLASFVAALPPPAPLVPTDESAQRRVVRGERAFTQFGCAECHVRRLGEVDGIFSDLLLHDLGPDLADPVAATPETADFARIFGFDPQSIAALAGVENLPGGLPGGVGGKLPIELPGELPLGGPLGGQAAGAMPSLSQLAATYSGMSSQSTEQQQEWRTPPLWGVRDSAPYLHDGRAKTLDEAIRAHGGEAAASVRAYQTASRDERQSLVEFLETR